jgi:hypothetical protein
MKPVPWPRLPAQGDGLLAHPSVLATQVLALLALALLLLAVVKRLGARLVDRPRLRPDLAHPWAQQG